MGGLVRTALRLTAVKALAGRTFAGDRVQDSSIAPLAEALVLEPQPVIVVYTDDDDITISGLDFLTPTGGTCAMVFLVAIAGAVALEGAAGWSVTFPETDEASEMTLDLLETDIKLALLDPRSPWSDLWRRFAFTGSRWRSQRGATEEKGARYAARQIILDLDPISDPTPGVAPVGLWADLIAAIAADPDPDFAALAPILTRAIVGPTILAERERERVNLGLTDAGGWASGLEPAPADYITPAGGDAVVLQEVDVDAGIAIDERVTRKDREP